jgi:hypothetical protein
MRVQQGRHRVDCGVVSLKATRIHARWEIGRGREDEGG